MGSVALLPRGFFHWKVKRVEDITPESLVLFELTQPRLGTHIYNSIYSDMYIMEPLNFEDNYSKRRIIMRLR